MMKTKSILQSLPINKGVLLVILSMVFFNAWAQEKLGMFVEVKRFFDNNRYTKYDIDYQVPYQNLKFLTRKNAFFAELKVTVSISKADSVIYNKEFTNNIGVSSKYDVTNSSKAFLDRISFTLAKPGFDIEILFEDINGGKTNTWKYSVIPLDKTDPLSDVELVSLITSDSTALSSKFKRDKLYYQPNPSGIFSKEMYDSLFCYIESYLKAGQKCDLKFTLSKDDKEVSSNVYSLVGTKVYQPIIMTIRAIDLDVGRYIGKVELTGLDKEYMKTFDLIINDQAEKLNFVFADPDEEYLLLRYLVQVKSQANWKSMSKEAKRRYNSQIWEALASSLGMTVPETITKYNERIAYSNKNFSHFDPGWKTDMGRIYIRLGAPYDIEKDITADDTRFVRKDYQIWRYSTQGSPVYIFVDMQMNGNYRLIYAKNDENEKTYPDWKKYMGSDFDEEQLTKKQQE